MSTFSGLNKLEWACLIFIGSVFVGAFLFLVAIICMATWVGLHWWAIPVLIGAFLFVAAMTYMSPSGTGPG